MAVLTPTKRDELLIRIDERQELIREHLEKLNSKASKNETRSKVNRYLISALLTAGGGGLGAFVAIG